MRKYVKISKSVLSIALLAQATISGNLAMARSAYPGFIEGGNGSGGGGDFLGWGGDSVKATTSVLITVDGTSEFIIIQKRDSGYHVAIREKDAPEYNGELNSKDGLTQEELNAAKKRIKDARDGIGLSVNRTIKRAIDIALKDNGGAQVVEISLSKFGLTGEKLQQCAEGVIKDIFEHLTQ